MPKLSKQLQEIRDFTILDLWRMHSASAQEIGKMFDLSTSTVYHIIKDHFEQKKKK